MLQKKRNKRESEQERSERVKLEAQIAPRRLTIEQQKTIAASLKRFKGGKVTLLTHVYDLEGAILASQIKSALQLAGISVNDRISSVMIIGGFIAGILINGPVAEQDLVKGLVDSLMHDGKLVVGNRGTTDIFGARPAAEGINILVGFKPPSPPLSKSK